MPPEATARSKIDEMLTSAGWVVHLPQRSLPLPPPGPPHLAAQVEALLRAAATPQPRDVLQHAVGLSDRKHFREALLNPMLAAQWLEMTIPEVPQSRLQRYQLTEKGRAWLSRLPLSR